MNIGFIFDLDGVLADTAEYHYMAWKELADALNIPIDQTFNEQLKGISRMDSLELILQYGKKEHTFTLAEKEKMATEKNICYLKLLENLSPNDVLSGVLPFLQEAQSLKIPCAIASASKNALFILRQLEIDSYFSFVVNPSTLEKGKPDPEIFLKAANGLDISPKLSIGFEDAQAGIYAIKAAGMYAVGIGEKEHLQGADYIVKDLSQLQISDLIHAVSNK